MLPKERLSLFDVLGDVHLGGVDSSEQEFCVKTGLVHLANSYTVPLNRSQEFLKNLLIPFHSGRLNEAKFSIVGSDFVETSRLELLDNNFIKGLQSLCECIKFSLQEKSLVNEGGQFGCCLRNAVGRGGCHTYEVSTSVCQPPTYLKGSYGQW